MAAEPSVVGENRFWVAEVAYVAIGVLAWFTLGGNIRLVTLALLLLFAVRTALHEKRRELEEKADEKIDNERFRD